MAMEVCRTRPQAPPWRMARPEIVLPERAESCFRPASVFSGLHRSVCTHHTPLARRGKLACGGYARVRMTLEKPSRTRSSPLSHLWFGLRLLLASTVLTIVLWRADPVVALGHLGRA